VNLTPREALLADRLERLYQAYGPETAETDPILLLGRYREAEDLEVAGWIASAFAYGRVETIQASVGRILAELGPRPARALDGIRDFREFARDALRGFRHRFHGAEDAAVLLFAIARSRAAAGTVRSFFESEYREEESDVGPLLSRAVARIRAFDYRPATGRRGLAPSSPANFFFPDPASGSACKRWNMYLRWMVRRDRLDLGLWPGIPTSRLVMPTDTHIHLVARRLRLTRRRTADWRTARQITDRLARIDPQDPVRYDYALCRLGILEICKPQRGRSLCSECPVREPCSVGGPKTLSAHPAQRMAS
jgi:uncharacterized protein (TIGR02757 family)